MSSHPAPPPPSSPLCCRCLAVGSSAAVLAFILYIFLQAHHATSIAASNQRAYEIVAAKKQAERALMMAERQKQVLLREQQAADAAAAAVVHEAEVRREYTALRVELRYPETVPDRHMMLSSMEKKIVEMKRELLRLQVLRQEQQAVNALRNQQQHQAVLAAAEREAKKPKPLPRQVSSSPCRSFTFASRVRAAACFSRTLAQRRQHGQRALLPRCFTQRQACRPSCGGEAHAGAAAAGGGGCQRCLCQDGIAKSQIIFERSVGARCCCCQRQYCCTGSISEGSHFCYFGEGRHGR